MIETFTPPIQLIYQSERDSFAFKVFSSIPVESIAFLVASFALKIFSSALAAPLLGIGVSILTTQLALKAIDCYDNRLLVGLSKEACKINKRYPKLQTITFICAMVLSFLSKTLGYFAGACLGSFGSIILDVENYKLLQHANRKT